MRRLNRAFLVFVLYKIAASYLIIVPFRMASWTRFLRQPVKVQIQA